MLTVYLAVSGGSVVLPEAVAVQEAGGSEEQLVQFVDRLNRVVAVFRRSDVVLYTADGAKYHLDGQLPAPTPSASL